MPASDAGPLPALDVLWLEDDDEFLGHAVCKLHEGSATIPESVGLRFKPRIQRASTLREALAALPRNPDLVIVDLNLPDSQGADTMMAVRRAAPGTPMLVLTVVGDIEPAMMTAVEEAEFLDKDDLSPVRLVRAVYMALMRTNAQAPSSRR